VDPECKGYLCDHSSVELTCQYCGGHVLITTPDEVNRRLIADINKDPDKWKLALDKRGTNNKDI